VTFAFIYQTDGWVESFHFPARASERGEKYSAQDATQVTKIVNTGNTETNQQVDAGHINDVHQCPVGRLPSSLRFWRMKIPSAASRPKMAVEAPSEGFGVIKNESTFPA